jgi:hypothetical protein
MILGFARRVLPVQVKQPLKDIIWRLRQPFGYAAARKSQLAEEIRLARELDLAAELGWLNRSQAEQHAELQLLRSELGEAVARIKVLEARNSDTPDT